MIIGLHMSKDQDLLGTLKRAIDLKFGAVQIFWGSSHRLAVPELTDEMAEEVRNLLCSGLKLYVHASYVAFPAQEKAGVRAGTLRYYMELARVSSAMGASGIVAHVGADKDSIGADRVKEVLEMVGDVCPLLLENKAGGKVDFGRTAESLFSMVENFPNAGVCWDTAHAFAAGMYPYTAESVTRLAGHLGTTLKLVHLNGVDGKVSFGCGRDIHGSLTSCPGEVSEMVKAWDWVNRPVIVEASGDYGLADVSYIRNCVGCV